MAAPELGDRARELADAVYHASEKCLMAHSIRAVEDMVESHCGTPHRVRVSLAAADRFLKRRAVAFIRPHVTEIFVAQEIGFEHQRLGIAHELAHILLCRLDGFPKAHTTQRNKLEEDACGLFEKHLCSMHDSFYANPENVARLRFRSLSAN